MEAKQKTASWKLSPKRKNKLNILYYVKALYNECLFYLFSRLKKMKTSKNDNFQTKRP